MKTRIKTIRILVATAVLGWAFKRGLVDPLFKFGMMPIVVATIGLSIAMRNGVRAGYSAEAHPCPSLFADKLFNLCNCHFNNWLCSLNELIFG